MNRTATLTATTTPTPGLGLAWLRDQRWDRIFILGGALLVPIPILIFYLCRALGLSISGAEDVVTALVMVLVGGPHVFATYTRTWFNRNFIRQDRGWFLLSFGVIALVSGAAIASAFFDVTIAGIPPTRFILTFFFFFAGIHIVQQASYCAACYDIKQVEVRGGAIPRRSWWNLLDYAVMLGALYPMSLFRMSMVNTADPTMATANPDALATVIARALGGHAFADEYVFRIGRVAPILPSFMMANALWVLVTAGFLAAVALFVVKTRRERREGTLNKPKLQLVAATATVGFFVPFLPNLDSAFQGFNAWHSFQYLGLLWYMNRRSYRMGEITSGFVRKLAEPRRARRYYLTGLTVTLSGIVAFLLVGLLIQALSGGEFMLLGRDDVPTNPDTGAPFYRPGSLLLAYYMIGFGFLLTHYVHDGLFFFRPRYVVGERPAS